MELDSPLNKPFGQPGRSTHLTVLLVLTAGMTAYSLYGHLSFMLRTEVSLAEWINYYNLRFVALFGLTVAALYLMAKGKTMGWSILTALLVIAAIGTLFSFVYWSFFSPLDSSNTEDILKQLPYGVVLVAISLYLLFQPDVREELSVDRTTSITSIGAGVAVALFELAVTFVMLRS